MHYAETKSPTEKNIPQDYLSLTYLEVRLAALMLKKVALDSIATALACE